MVTIFDILWQVIAGGIVLLLPGLAWWGWFPEKKGNFLSQLADIVGLSLSLTALASLAAFVVGWRISAAGLIGLYLFGGLLAGMGAGTHRFYRGAEVVSRPSPAWVVGSLVFFISLLAWRFYQTRALVLPAWVDSLHHVLIVKSFLENGGIPQTLAPYLPIPFFYHYGFHATAAAYTFIGGISPSQAVLWIGQVLNAMVALSVYRLGMALWDDWRRAALAALLTGFVSHMPAYYVSWGRYPLLAGLILLPLAIATALEILHSGATFARLSRLIILTGGILLAHYFAALLLGTFLFLVGGWSFCQDFWQRRFRSSLPMRSLSAFFDEHRWSALSLGASAGILMAFPWLYRMWSYGQRINISAVLSTQAAEAAYFSNYSAYLWRMLGPRQSHFLLILAVAGLFFAVIRRRSRLFALWSILLGLFSLPWGIRLSPFRPDHAAIVLFLPVTLLGSDFFLSTAEILQRGQRARLSRGLSAIAISGLLIWGLKETRGIVNPTTVLATEADLHAIEWIEQNTPTDARFLINVAYWQDNAYRGVDGGWWIPLLSGRETLLPPVLYGWGERDYVGRVNELAKNVSQLQTCSPEFWELVEANDVNYIYLGKNVGSLQPSALQDCAGLTGIYAAEGVFIYQILR
jgi:hypothetical protein